MTIQCDDSNWGCPVGPTLIGALRVETGEYVVEELPIGQFQGAAFLRKDYLEGARAATERCLARLHHVPDEALEICTGYVHDRTRAWFSSQGFTWQTTKVEGRLQQLVEASTAEMLHRLGFDYRGSTEKYGMLFLEAIKWLKGGNPNATGMVPERVAVAKSGWATFHFYRDLPYAEAAAASKQFKARQRSRRGRWGYRGGYEEE